MAKKQQRLKSKAKASDDDAVYEEGEEGEWTDEEGNPIEDPEVEPQAVPGAALPRTTTVTTANPTPPTNVAVEYQGTPPTPTGAAGAAASAIPPSTAGGAVAGITPPVGGTPRVLTDAGIVLFADPANGAVAQSAVRIPTLPVTAPAAELAGKAEGSGSTTVLYWPLPGTSTAANGTDAARGVGPGVYTELPNKDHPSYGT